MEVDTLKREPFPEAGEGVFLAIRGSGARELYKAYGPEWLGKANALLAVGDIEVMEIVLKHSAEKDGKPVEISLDDIIFLKISIEKLAQRLLNAYSLGAYGRTWEDQVAYIDKLRKDAEDVERPFQKPADGSDGLSERPMPPASDQKTLNF